MWFFLHFSCKFWRSDALKPNWRSNFCSRVTFFATFTMQPVVTRLYLNFRNFSALLRTSIYKLNNNYVQTQDTSSFFKIKYRLLFFEGEKYSKRVCYKSVSFHTCKTEKATTLKKTKCIHTIISIYIHRVLFEYSIDRS